MGRRQADTTRLGLVTVALTLCGTLYVALGVTALGAAGAAGILGGLLICSVVPAARHAPRPASAVLVLGAVPFAVATWWSVVTPLLALLALGIGRGVVARAGSSSHWSGPPLLRMELPGGGDTVRT